MAICLSWDGLGRVERRIGTEMLAKLFFLRTNILKVVCLCRCHALL